MKNLRYAKHAEEKLKERGIFKDEVETLIKYPEDVLLDTETGNLILVGKRENKPNHILIVVYSPEEVKVITVIDTSKADIVEKRKEKGKWIKIK